ncbi:MAG: MetS family NSS transporter small subunit [candidate division WOR-3 bacterium]|nr:MetS family NSS transporter small subunit [candidate division WOR-3 bacterium]
MPFSAWFMMGVGFLITIGGIIVCLIIANKKK